MIRGRSTVSIPAILFVAVTFLQFACADVEIVTGAYATIAEAQQSGALERGWIPPVLPPSAHDIRIAHDLERNRRWGLFNFLPTDIEALRQRLEPDEISATGLNCGIPKRIEWWPLLLRGDLEGDQIKTAGLQIYRARKGDLIVAINWKQGRAYYWNR